MQDPSQTIGGLGAILALIVFGLAVFGGGCLTLVAYFLYRRVSRTSLADARFLRDFMIETLCSAAFLVIEAATLVWDNLTHRQFPVAIRWACLVVLIPTITTVALRLLGYYLEQSRTDA